MATVQKITLADRGQDFTEWYVRDGIVIDCQPCQGRVWVGTKLSAPAVAHQAIRVITPAQGKEFTLDYPAQEVETLSADEASEVESIGRKWAEMKGIPASDLGL